MKEHFAHFDKRKGKGKQLHIHLMAPVEEIESSIPPSVRFPAVSNIEMEKLACSVYLFHDFGKYTQWFQDFVTKGVVSEYKSHSFISACLTYKYLLAEQNYTPEEAMKAFVAFISVLRHHSYLEVLTLDKHANVILKRVEKQSQHLKNKLSEIFLEAPWSKFIEEKTMAELLKVQELFRNDRLFWDMPFRIKSKRQYQNYWYFLLIYLFSILIDADKTDSANMSKRQIFVTDPERVVSYLEQKHKGTKTDLTNKRENARKTITSTIDNLTDDQIVSQRFFILTAPTGIGKTLSCLQAALKLQKRIEKIEGYVPRIITAIPFINIIEQTRHDYEEIFSEGVIVHHRLSDFTQQQHLVGAEEDIPVDKQLLQVEAWEGQTVLTTFVQLFNSLLTGRNRSLKKVNKLAGSIVILDEIQSISYDKMPLIGAVLQKVAEFYGTRFILMSATQPLLLELGTKLICETLPSEKKEISPIPLLPNYQEFFKCLHRTRFIPCLEETYDTDSFCNFVLKEIKKLQKANKKTNKCSSVLIVVNTIQQSIDIYKKLCEFRREKKFSKTPKILCLSTNLIPKHRMNVIRFVQKCLEKKKPVILVSTQTIEAGVDLDFDIGFRDLAPLPSLIQTAGRVNRNGNKGAYCPVYIVQIKKDCSWVYNTSEISTTKKLLKIEVKNKVIYEQDYQALVEKYYREMEINGLDTEIKNIWETGVLGLDFETINKFSLIDNVEEVADVFIEYDKNATCLIKAYKTLMDQPEIIEWSLIRDVFPNIQEQPDFSNFTRRAILRLLNTKMSDFVVQIRVSKLKNKPPFEFCGGGNLLYWIPKSEKKLFYSLWTGYKAEHQAYVY